MKYFDWDDAKNAKLRAERGIGFEDIVFHIERGGLLDILEHPNADRYAGQRILVVRREEYVYLVPFVEDEPHGLPEGDHPEPEGDEAVLGARSPTMKLDADEKELLASVERGEWKSANAASASTPLLALREGHVPEGSGVEHPPPSEDLEAIPKRALAEGLP